jgi:hypothetical protein
LSVDGSEVARFYPRGLPWMKAFPGRAPSIGDWLPIAGPVLRIYARLQVSGAGVTGVDLWRWAELSEVLGFPVEHMPGTLRGVLGRHDLVLRARGLEVAPTIGDLDIETSGGLARALSAYGSCLFVFTRQGPIRFYRGAVRALVELHRTPLFEAPDAVLAESGAWALVQQTDCTSAYLVGSEEVVGAVLAEPAVEAVRTARDAAVDDWTARG